VTSVHDTPEIIDIRTVRPPVTIVGVFPTGRGARAAARMLERAGFPPDRIGIVAGNVRQAREVAGSYSREGALAGAVVGALLALAFMNVGGETVRLNALAFVFGAPVLVVGFAAIGWLAGRARVFKKDEYEELEEHVEHGEILVSVVCDTAEGVELARATLERAGATEIRVEPTDEAF
jgi:hypothetical protein